MKKKIILLDLGGVVFNSTGTSNLEIDWKVITDLNHKHGFKLNIGEDVFPLFMKDYNERTRQSLSGADFLRLIFDTLSFNSELIEMLQEHFRIYIVSDNYRENIAYISQRYHFSEWSEKEFYSFDFKKIKSDPTFFQDLLEEIKVEASELLFIDDSIRKLESAQKNGIQGILFKNNEQLRNDLKPYLFPAP